MAWRKIKIGGIFVKGSKSGKTIKISLNNFEDDLDELKTALRRKPTWKTQGYGEKEREFYITFNGGIGEVWSDEEEGDMPPDYDNTKQPDLPTDEDDIPF